MSLKVKFWGVRGSIACPSPNHISFGGNTSCVEVSAGGHRFILDAGTGVRNLGHWIFRKGPNHVTFLFSHTHWDHINGFPFFSPAFHPDYVFNMLAGHLNDQGGLQRVMAGQMSELTFPVPLEAMRARLEFGDFKAGDNWSPVPGVVIRTAPLNHPNGATGYRIEHGGRSVCYITDTEHVPDKPDQNILGLIEGADLVVYDSTYTDEEFVGKVGWGHSTWQEGIRLAQAANVRSLAIFHHNPDHEDRFMEQIEVDARALWRGAFVARENMRLVLG